jgi:hypothetical protein
MTEKKEKMYYWAVPPLAQGWSSFKPDQLRRAGEMLCAAKVNANSGWFQSLYPHGILGFWAWNPKTYDESKARLRIYGDVFGPSAAGAALEFDDAFLAAARLFIAWSKEKKTSIRRPLEEVRKEPALTGYLAVMKRSLGAIGKTAREETLLDTKDLNECYLDPMSREVEALEKFLKKGG